LQLLERKIVPHISTENSRRIPFSGISVNQLRAICRILTKMVEHFMRYDLALAQRAWFCYDGAETSG
jgi:hypothetical protein